MKIIRTIMVTVCILLLTACATVPRESVDLSSEVGKGIRKQYQSQIDLVNLYFAVMREKLDQAMQRALNTYFATLTPSGSITLNRSQLNDVATDVINLNAKHAAAKEELEKSMQHIGEAMAKGGAGGQAGAGPAGETGGGGSAGGHSSFTGGHPGGQQHQQSTAKSPDEIEEAEVEIIDDNKS